MKSLTFISLILTLLISNTLFSQVTITDLSVKKVERVIEKPLPYDSLKNWEKFDKKLDYKKYIGLQVYFPPFKSEDIYGFISKKSEEITDRISDNYYTLLDVLYGDTLNYLFKNILTEPERGDEPEMLFVLKNEKLGDTIYYDNSDQFSKRASLPSLILVPYFVKQKQLFKDKTLIFTDEQVPNSFIRSYYNCNITTYDILIKETKERNDGQLITQAKEVKVLRGSKWICTDVTVMKYCNVYSLDVLKEFTVDEKEYAIFYILKNEKNEAIAFTYLHPLKGVCYNSDSGGMYDCGNPQQGFVFESDYIKAKKLSEQKVK